MPLTPAEEQELKALEAHYGGIGQGNPDAIRVEVPDTYAGATREASRDFERKLHGGMPVMQNTPAELAMARMGVGAAGGAALASPESASMFAKPFKATGRGIRHITDWLSSALAKMHPSEVAGFKQAPDEVIALSKLPSNEKSKIAEQALRSSAEDLKGRAGQLSYDLERQLSGRQVPQSDVQGAKEFLEKSAPGTTANPTFPRSSNPLSTSYDAADLIAPKRLVGDQMTSWKLDPSGTLMKSTDPAAGQAYGELKQAMLKANPKTENTLQALEGGIDQQKAVNASRSNPIGYFESTNPDVDATRLSADELTNSNMLQSTASKFQGAKGWSRHPTTLIQSAYMPAGKAGLWLGAKGAPVASKATDVGAWMATKGLGRAIAPKITDPRNDSRLSPEEEQELQQLEQELSSRK